VCLSNCFESFPYLNQFHVYIDVNNVVYFGCDKNKTPKLKNLIELLSQLIEVYGFKRERLHCICDPALRYHIDQRKEFEALIRDGLIVIAPKVADEFILSFAQNHEFCFIISNDRFREYIPQLPGKQWIEERRVSFMILEDKVCLSPNIKYSHIDVLPLEEQESKTGDKCEFVQINIKKSKNKSK